MTERMFWNVTFFLLTLVLVPLAFVILSPASAIDVVLGSTVAVVIAAALEVMWKNRPDG